jgi:hypothetical protein
MSAWAGCPNTCDASVTEGPVMEPPLSCLEIRAVAGSCECHALLEVHNTCTSNVNAVGFTFLNCLPASSTGASGLVRDTGTIQPGHSCMREELLTGNGTTDYEYHFTQDGTDHTLTFQVEVRDFDGSPGCACSTPGRSMQADTGPITVIALCMGATGVMLRRKRRQFKPSIDFVR